MIQPRLQRGGVAPADGAAELVEAHRAVQERPDDVHRPLLLQQRDRIVDRAVPPSSLHVSLRWYRWSSILGSLFHRLTNYSTSGYHALYPVRHRAGLAVSEHSRRSRTMGWTLDPHHTSVSFSAKHLGVATVRGQFNGVTAEVEL